MAVTVHYLNWDRGEAFDEAEMLFHDANVDRRLPDSLEHHREVLTEDVEVGSLEEVWTALQHGVPIADHLYGMRDALVEAEERSMCVGDIIETDDGAYVAAGFGFSEVDL